METRPREDRQPDAPSGLDHTHTQTHRDKNDLNFGWFTLPASSEVSARPGEKSDGAFLANSNDGGQFSQGEPDNVYTHPARKTPESCGSTAQGGGDRIDGGASPMAAPGTAQETETTPDDIPTMTVKYNENFVVDWPLSSVGLEQSRRISVSDQESRLRAPSTRPWVDDSAPQVPPTPLPPLHWHGYRGSSRPTYKTWQDHWHKSHSHGSVDGNNNATEGGEQDSNEEDEKDLINGASQRLPNGRFHYHSSDTCNTDISSGLLHESDKPPVPVSIQADGKAVYMSIPQTTKKTTFLDSARSRIHSFPFLKWSCWKKGKGSNVKLLKYKKLSDEESGEDNDFFNNY